MRRIAAECIYIDERGGVRHSARAGGGDRAANSESNSVEHRGGERDAPRSRRCCCEGPKIAPRRARPLCSPMI